MKKIYAISVLLLFAASVWATNYYVKPTGGENYSGSKWSLANGNLQKIINAAAAGDTIFVAAGTYAGGFVMREGITVRGGYTANTANPAERILPADAASESQMSILDGGGTQRTLTQITNFGVRTVWDGFVVKGGTSASADVAVGSLVYAENNTDIVAVVYQYDAGSETGKMIAIAEEKTVWGGYQMDFEELPYLGNAANDMNGAENTQIIVDKFAEIPAYLHFPNNAAQYGKGFSAGGFTGWHLPATGEWVEVFAAKNIINSIMIAANAPLANGFWTSNHAGELLAWAYYFEDGRQIPTLKYIAKNIRTIRSFQKSELNIPTDTGSSVSLKTNGTLNYCFVDGEAVNEEVSVKNVTADNIAIIGYYNIIGQRLLAKPESGIYIILYDNGKTEKIIVY